MKFTCEKALLQAAISTKKKTTSPQPAQKGKVVHRTLSTCQQNVDNSLIPGVDVGVDVLNDLRHLRGLLHELFHPLNGVHHGGVVPVQLPPAQFPPKAPFLRWREFCWRLRTICV